MQTDAARKIAMRNILWVGCTVSKLSTLVTNCLDCSRRYTDICSSWTSFHRMSSMIGETVHLTMLCIFSYSHDTWLECVCVVVCLPQQLALSMC